ncbi:MAG: LysR family transcriptional regulator [Salinisphaera sp.]|uniref:LysR family transcriptional regulator n=1 Tax=Salinisphaera sp. TaxID=1914330 RepID=UPI003C7E5106
MDIRHLKYFLALAEYGSVHGAAKAVFVSQPAVSRRLRDLEAELGVTLYERSAQGTRLTPAGQTLRDAAQEALTGLDAGVRRCQAIGQGRLGTLRLGFVDNATWDGRLGQVFERFRQAEPEVALDLRPMNSPEQRTALFNGTLDGAFGYPFGNLADSLTWIPITKYPVMLAWPYSNEDAPRSLAEAARYPFIGFPGFIYPAYYDQLHAAIDATGNTLQFAQLATTEAAMLSLVAARVGVALVNGANRYRPPAGVSFHGLRDIDLELPLCFLYREENASPVLTRFLESLSEA